MEPTDTDGGRRPLIVPRYHDTVTLAVPGGGVRVLVTAGGLVYPLFRYVQSYPDRSPEWQRKTVRAAGLLFDYATVVPLPPGLAGRRQYLSGFVSVLLAGTIDDKGEDPLGLFWPSQGRAAVGELVWHLDGFLDYVQLEYPGADALNPSVPASFEERMAALRRLDEKNKHSLLQHLGSGDAARRGAAVTRLHRRPRAHKVAPASPPAFPHEQFDALLWEGFARRGAKESDPPWARWNLRDVMVAILGHHGGLRASDCFHLFVTDVLENPSQPGVAEVRLYHPEDGAAPVLRNGVTRRLERATRTEYLRTQYGLKPRTQLTGTERVGWKNLLLEVGAPQLYALVHWTSPEWGRLFWTVYRLYVEHVRPRGLDHPYLFVNLADDRGCAGAEPAFGAPYRLASYDGTGGAFARAVRRIGLLPRKKLGTTSHGLRHAYAQILLLAGIPQKVIQVCLHHKSPESQAVYTQLGVAGVNRLLENARPALAGAAPKAPSALSVGV